MAKLPEPKRRFPTSVLLDPDVHDLVQIHKQLHGNLSPILNDLLREFLPAQIEDLTKSRTVEVQSVVDHWHSIREKAFSAKTFMDGFEITPTCEKGSKTDPWPVTNSGEARK